MFEFNWNLEDLGILDFFGRRGSWFLEHFNEKFIRK